jgi:cytochrome c oxidase cbb3-type subunit I/II
MGVTTISYDNRIVKQFAYATIFWGVVGMLVGLLIALQLYFPALNFDLPYTSFGRARPIHTNAVIFAFVGNGIFTGVYYSLQRLLKARMASSIMSALHFWGWQLIIVFAALSYAFGYTTGKEYAELEWSIDVVVAVVWVIFGLNMMVTIARRNVSHIYVAIWFYIATWVTVAVLHIGNSIAIPVGLLKSYPVYAGVQDALVQWWYGHNAVAFFLTTPYLGLMYYFVPKAAGRPVYSYRLSILHFWALIFLYIWAGPHHLLFSSLPGWAQSLGVTFSIMLIAPSWGGMVNGLLTLRGAWDRVRESAVLKFMVVAITAYGMSTFEGPMLSIKMINAISHYTDWTVGHAHIGALGWNGFLTFGMLYWLVPRLFRTKLYSGKLANTHFWFGTLGILLYAVPLYWAAITQFLMWRQFTPEGYLAYPNFLDTVTQIVPMYLMRAIGGALYIVGFLIMIYNIIMTVRSGSFVKNENAEITVDEAIEARRNKGESMHRWLERRPIQFLIVTLLAILVGGLVEIVPTYLIKKNIPTIESVKPYTALELEGRDIYIAEGCNTCHSQMIRPFRFETERYGEYSKAGEFVYDHPFLWGSKRTGPDLARIGQTTGRNYKPDLWHYNHLMDPRSTSQASIMPAYPWLAKDEINMKQIPKKIRVMRTLGVPYDESYVETASKDLIEQATRIADGLRAQGVDIAPNKKIIALIAYMQRLGTDITAKAVVAPAPAAPATTSFTAFLTDDLSIKAGAETFVKLCAVCHLPDGGGLVGPNMTDKYWIHEPSPQGMYDLVYNGLIEKGMTPFKDQLSPEQIQQVISYIITMQGTTPAKPKEPQGTLFELNK